MKGLKIILLADALTEQKAGIHFYSKSFIQYITSYFPENEYITITSKPYEMENCKNIVLPINSIPLHFRLRSFFEIPNTIKKEAADITIELAHFGPFNLPKHIKRITVIHDLTPVTHPGWHNKVSYWAHKIFLPGIIKKAHSIIANSQTTKSELETYYPESKSKTYIYQPKSKYDSDSIDKSVKSQISSNSKYILSIGTIEPRKNYIAGIEAFERIKKEFPDLKWKIAGYKGWKSEAFLKKRDTSEFKEDIQLLNYVSDQEMQTLIRNAKAFLWLSLKEGLGMPLIDALYFNKAILSNDIPSAKEVCDTSAQYFDAQNPNELYSLLKNILLSKGEQGKWEEKAKNRYAAFVQKEQEVSKLFKNLLS